MVYCMEEGIGYRLIRIKIISTILHGSRILGASSLGLTDSVLSVSFAVFGVALEEAIRFSCSVPKKPVEKKPLHLFSR